MITYLTVTTLILALSFLIPKQILGLSRTWLVLANPLQHHQCKQPHNKSVTGFVRLRPSVLPKTFARQRRTVAKFKCSEQLDKWDVAKQDANRQKQANSLAAGSSTGALPEHPLS